ncbi:LamG-like jellyroll fold domain-containing protein [Hydrogenophaga sp. T2]|uniref:LamG-like jellyroll fold domain-containing protein n=1 Tax=Hydrogenophaga sp. T2 TaxID=3132823 RepID=UPI003CF13486
MAALKPGDQRCEAEGVVGNPIRVTTGAKLHRELSGMGVGGQELALSYSSDLAIQAVAAARAVSTLGASPIVGGHWQSSLHRQLHFPGKGLSIQLHRGDGHATNFRYDQVSKIYVADAGSSYSLSYAGGLYRVVNRDGFVETYNSAGKITRYEGIDGSQLTFAYSTATSADAPGAGYLLEVTDQNTRVMRFAYNANGRLVRVTDPSTRELKLSYDANGLLATIEWPDTQIKTFLYENGSFAHALTGVVDERGTRLSTFTYDGAGRATSTERAGGVNRYEVSYGTPPGVSTQMQSDPTTGYSIRRQAAVAPQGTQVTGPNGQLGDVGAALIDGVAHVTSSSQPAGSGCAAASSHKGYDSVGNTIVEDNFSGERSCMAYDSLNRMTTRVDGLATSVSCASVLPTGSTLPGGARRTDYEWHPDWNLPTKVTQPGRMTRTVYQGQPDPTAGNAIASCSAAPLMSHGKTLPLVCKRVEQALDGAGSVDAAIAAQIQTMSYDVDGRLRSHTDSRSQVMGYSYHASTSYISPAGDPIDDDFDKVTLLLKGNGLPGSRAVLDGSSRQTPIGVFGNTSISNAQSVFGGTSITFNGIGDYITVPHDATNSLSTGDFTVEMFVYKVANNSNASRLWNGNGDSIDSPAILVYGNGDLGVYLSTSGSAWEYSEPAVATLANGQWYHLAVVRSGGSVFTFVNGVKYTITTTLGKSTPLYVKSSNTRSIGGQSASQSGTNRSLNGYIDEFRITRGKARYTESFTPPTAEFPAHAPQYSPNDVGHSKGDLASVTNAAGHVTRYTKYDRAGRVRQMIDPKGVVSDITYTPRGWLSSVSSTPPGGAARTTTYSYDNAGQLTSVSQPDGTTLSYVYDAAQRLVGVSDERGNTVSYTLDNMGNRVGEEVKDPGGVLRRSISRSFDPLNRLQQITGAAQ